MNNQCDVCGKPAVQWWSDPWGKTDIKYPKCAEHGTRFVDAAEVDRLKAELERCGHALLAIADDGWLMHGPEGMSEAQKMVWDIVQTLPEYLMRVTDSAEGKQHE